VPIDASAGPGSAEAALSLSYYTVPELDALETVRVAAATGCRHVGLRLLGGQPGADDMPLMTDARLRRAMRRTLAETGVSALDANTARLLPETDVTAFGGFLDVAAELGARHVLASADDPDRDRTVDRFGRLCEMAERVGLTVDIEFVPWMAVSDLRAAADVVRACGHDALGIAVDALHFDRSGSDAADLARMPRHWFRYAQVCDAPPATGRDRPRRHSRGAADGHPAGAGGADDDPGENGPGAATRRPLRRGDPDGARTTGPGRLKGRASRPR
jgi:sugar phosphate isomerase/epimerase